MGVTPVNYRRQDRSPEALAADVDYALQVADFYVGALPGGAAELHGARVLELGPGASLGTAVVLACHGASVTVADRFLAPWDPAYHGPFFRALAERLARERPGLDRAPLEALLVAGRWVPAAVTGWPRGSEDLRDVPDGRFDVVLSNAVFEHVRDVPTTLGNLSRITRPGGCGIHQVDFRDHRDFARPLEFLTLDGAVFARLFEECHGECGNRWRAGALAGAFVEAGFELLAQAPNLHAEPDYLRELRPRLHADFAGLPDSELSVLSACLTVRREAQTAAPGATSAESRRLDRLARFHFAAQFAARRRVALIGLGGGGDPLAGVSLLRAAGADDVAVLDGRGERLQSARARDAGLRCEIWRAGGPLPFADGAIGLLVAVDEPLPAAHWSTFTAEVRRVLAEDGLALLLAPDVAPAGVAPQAEALVALFEGFDWVEFLTQVRPQVSLVVPLGVPERALLPAHLHLPTVAGLAPAGSGLPLALCWKRRPSQPDPGRPAGAAN